MRWRVNPELLRNVWLELTPRRLAIMPIVLGVVLLVPLAAPFGEGFYWTGRLAEAAYYILAVVWGAHLAAGAVSGEIRARTWDGQRMSSMAPWSMTWAKLIGAPIYAWYGGVICLAAIAVATIAQAGPAAAATEVIRLLIIGLTAQSASLFVSMAFVHKGAAQSRLLTISSQIAGLAAAYIAHKLISAGAIGAYPTGASLVWYRSSVSHEAFVLASLIGILAWAVIGIHRLLRLELQEDNRPWVWLGFLAYVVVYLIGFPAGPAAFGISLLAEPLALAGAAITAITYAAMLMEPKDPVRYRRLIRRFGERPLGPLFLDLPRWVFGYAVVATIVALLVAIGYGEPAGSRIGPDGAHFAIAFAAFVGRDLGLFLFFGMTGQSGRSDLATVVYLAILYLALPFLVASLEVEELMPMLLPSDAAGTALQIGAPVLEMIAVWGFLALRWRGARTIASLPPSG